MIQFNHNGSADPPGWDDVAFGLLQEAARLVNRGEAKLALLMAEGAIDILEKHIEEDA